MDTLPQVSGIYKWTCIPTKKIYIGSAKHIHKRYVQHIGTLRSGKHVNCYLQNAWNKYSEDAFTFEVIELVLETFRLEREQYWLDKLRPFDRKKGFNTSPTAGTLLGSKYPEGRGRKWTHEQRQAMSEYRKRNPIPPEQREKMIAGLKGQVQAQATLDAGFQRHAKWYVFTDPNGREYITQGQKRFCDEHALDRKSIWKVLTGRIQAYRGWTCQCIECPIGD